MTLLPPGFRREAEQSLALNVGPPQSAAKGIPAGHLAGERIGLMDGHDGIGQVVTGRAVALGVDRAREHGISGVAVRNSNHFGTAAYFTRRVARAGCVGLLFTNASTPTEPIGGLLVALAGLWMAWSAQRSLS